MHAQSLHHIVFHIFKLYMMVLYCMCHSITWHLGIFIHYWVGEVHPWWCCSTVWHSSICFHTLLLMDIYFTCKLCVKGSRQICQYHLVPKGTRWQESGQSPASFLEACLSSSACGSTVGQVSCGQIPPVGCFPPCCSPFLRAEQEKSLGGLGNRLLWHQTV